MVRLQRCKQDVAQSRRFMRVTPEGRRRGVLPKLGVALTIIAAATFLVLSMVVALGGWPGATGPRSSPRAAPAASLRRAAQPQATEVTLGGRRHHAGALNARTKPPGS